MVGTAERVGYNRELFGVLPGTFRILPTIPQELIEYHSKLMEGVNGSRPIEIDGFKYNANGVYRTEDRTTHFFYAESEDLTKRRTIELTIDGNELKGVSVFSQEFDVSETGSSLKNYRYTRLVYRDNGFYIVREFWPTTTPRNKTKVFVIDIDRFSARAQVLLKEGDDERVVFSFSSENGQESFYTKDQVDRQLILKGDKFNPSPDKIISDELKEALSALRPFVPKTS